MFAEGLQCYSSEGIWQVSGLEVECIVVYLVGDKEHLGSGNSLCITISREDGVNQCDRRGVPYSIVLVYGSLAKDFLHSITYYGEIVADMQIE